MTPVKLYIDHKQISAKSPSLSKDIIEFATKLSYFCKEGYKFHDRESIAIFGDRLKKNKDCTDLEYTELAILSFVRCFYDKTIPEELRTQFQVFAIGKNLAHCVMAIKSKEQSFVCDLWLDYLENPSNKIEFSYQNSVYPLEIFTKIVCEKILLLQDPQLIPLFKVVESIKQSKFKIIERLECNENNEKVYPELINLL